MLRFSAHAHYIRICVLFYLNAICVQGGGMTMSWLSSHVSTLRVALMVTLKYGLVSAVFTPWRNHPMTFDLIYGVMQFLKSAASMFAAQYNSLNENSDDRRVLDWFWSADSKRMTSISGLYYKPSTVMPIRRNKGRLPWHHLRSLRIEIRQKEINREMSSEAAFELRCHFMAQLIQSVKSMQSFRVEMRD